MSDRQRNFFNKCTCYLCIAGAFVLLVVFFAFKGPTPPPEPLTRTDTAEPPQNRAGDRTRTRPVFDSEAFYRTIIDNNLFRPLGWTPPRPQEPYRLLGTILPRDANTPPQAILQSTTGHQTYIVTLGSNLDADTQVVDIQSKQVTLFTQGQQRTLMLPSGF